MTCSDRLKHSPALLMTLGLVCWLGLQSCSPPAWQAAPHDRLFQQARPPELHPIVEAVETTEWVPAFWYSSFGQLSHAYSPGWHLQQAVDGPRALDVNEFGKVPDSTWFENRLGRQRMSIAEIRQGPNQHPPPNLHKLVVKSGKTGGVTPGFIVTDADDVRWIVKFDHPAFPELSSGAEIVSTKLMYAAGYHVPENHAVSFYLDRLELDPNATTRDRYHRKVPLSWSNLRHTLQLLNPSGDGRVRALFSRFLPGKPLGPFSMHGVRLDDPNDTIPHERRRSLRGVWVFYAWINNTDAKYTNTLDMFRESDPTSETGYIQHYLIDFGTAFGATPGGPKARSEGNDYTVDWGSMGQRLSTLGIQYPAWATVRRTPFRSVGTYDGQNFDPAHFKPKYPNPQFEAADELDTFWAAAILAHFGPLEVAAAVSAADYSEPGAAEWLAATLMLRRDKMLQYAFRNLTPLDDPRVTRTNELQLTDLEVRAGLKRRQQLQYLWGVEWHEPDGDRRTIGVGKTKQPSLRLGPLVNWLQHEVGAQLARAPFLTVSWRRCHDGGEPGPALEVHLRVLAEGRVIPVGLERGVR